MQVPLAKLLQGSCICTLIKEQWIVTSHQDEFNVIYDDDI